MPTPSDPADPTTLHVQRAREGDVPSLTWLVERFSPFLLAQARFRIGARSAARIDPEDVVQDVWAIALPRLSSLATREGRSTPVLMRFLGTTLLHHVNNLLRRRIQGSLEAGGEESSPFLALPDETRGPLTRAVRNERRSLLAAAIEELSERDRELVVLRAIEQRSNEETAEILGLAPNTAAQGFHRALERLRERFPSAVLDELADASA